MEIPVQAECSFFNSFSQFIELLHKLFIHISKQSCKVKGVDINCNFLLFLCLLYYTVNVSRIRNYVDCDTQGVVCPWHIIFEYKYMLIQGLSRTLPLLLRKLKPKRKQLPVQNHAVQWEGEDSNLNLWTLVPVHLLQLLRDSGEIPFCHKVKGDFGLQQIFIQSFPISL